MILAVLVCAAAPLQYSFTVWNWDTAYRDMDRFKQTVDACSHHGFNLIELGAGWTDCEKQEGQFDFSMVDERVAYVVQKGLKIRLRVNMLHTPDWVKPEVFASPDGTPYPYTVPSLFNERNRQLQHRFAGELAKHLAGRGFTYTPGFSVHMEVKFADWNCYEDSAKKSFRQFLAAKHGDIAALNAAWGSSFASMEEVQPPVPGLTSGEPSLDTATNDWIRFREEGLARWVTEFAETVRRNDPSARISIPLGESYRAGSAQMANLAYWEFSRPTDEVVHSYDFFWHKPAGAANAKLAAAIMTGITQRPVVFECDGPYLFEQHGYTEDDVVRCAQYALEGGAAGIQVSNWGSIDDIAGKGFMTAIGRLIRERSQTEPRSSAALYYVSKWQNYCYRESNEWHHDRQFDFWRLLDASGARVRIVTDENVLHEDLHPETVYLPFARIMDPAVADRLKALGQHVQLIPHAPWAQCTPEGRISAP